MTPLVLMTLLAAAAPGPAFLAKFKPVQAPVTLNDKTPEGEQLPDAELAAVWPVELKREPGTRAFAMGRLGELLFVRFRLETPRSLRVSDEVLTLGKGGIAVGAAELSSSNRDVEGASTSTAVVAANRAVSMSGSWNERIEELDQLQLKLAAKGEVERAGTLKPDGTLSWGDARVLNIEGSWIDPKSSEFLVLVTDAGRLRAFFAKTPKAKLGEAKVEGTATDLTITVHWGDGQPHTLKPDARRLELHCSNPDKSVQTFVRDVRL